MTHSFPTRRASDLGGAILVNPGRPIPPITQAVHHILEEQVADAPWWHDIARQVLDPWPRRLALAAHRADFEQQFCTPPLTHGADWICRSEEHTSELQSLMRISYAVSCLKKNKRTIILQHI